MFYPCHQKGRDIIKRNPFYNLNLLPRLSEVFHISFILDKRKGEAGTVYRAYR